MLVGQILRQRYKIIRLLGSGSFGVTYLAEDLDLPDHPWCVVKNLKQMQNREHLQLAKTLFDREAKVLSQLGNECSQIPRLFAHFEQNGEFYLVQEFVDGHDLSKEIFPGNRLSEAQVAQMLQEILEVLRFIHDRNIIHRDIKAQNLMRRNTDGKIVLIDFGAVKQISGLGVNGQTNISIVVGTSGYMPSEQLNGYPKLSSDIYAVGMLGIYALTGIPPQELPKKSDTFEVVWRNLVSVSSRLADVLDKMINYDFNKRYQTAAEALQALTLLSLPPSTPRAPESRVNQKVLIEAGVAAGVLIGIGLLFMSFLKKPVPNLDQPVSDVQLVCPKTSIPTLPNKPDWEYNNTKYYGYAKVQPITGKGTMILPDKTFGGYARYDGELKNGMFSGCGTYTFANGAYYQGEFENSYFQGTGKFIGKSGCQYVGEFKNGYFYGQGTLTDKDGSRFSGIWQQGKLKGSNRTFKCE